MKLKAYIYTILLSICAITMVAQTGVGMPPPDDKNKKQAKTSATTSASQSGTAQKAGGSQTGRDGEERGSLLLEIEDEDVPDSLRNPKWKVQRTQPITLDDLQQNGTDLARPENMQYTTEYNDTLKSYIIGTKMGQTYLTTPFMLNQQEYLQWSEQQLMRDYFRKKNDEIFQAKGKEKFDFTDLHFDLGPAEKIFGPGGVRIRTQGTAELKLGATMKNIDNPSLPVHNRKTTQINFDEKINLNMNGSVGDKMKMNLNYNTDATFDYDAQNIKLKYDGKEDEIIKLVEAGNVSFPSNSSLISGASSLFGLRTDMQFGRLKLQLVASQKKSNSSSVSSQGGVQLTPFEIDAANYEENRHFFLSQYFREKYNAAMRTLPNLTTGIHINRVEIWVTNKTGTTNNTRNIVALTDLGENSKVSNPLWGITGQTVPSNQANTEYAQMVSTYAAARDIDQTSTVLEGIPGFVGGNDYEKLESARLLSSSEYSVNTSLGYVTLKTALQTDQVLAIAYEYTYGGQTFQVGEFASDYTDVTQALFVKSLKNTSNNPAQGNWDLMMKNVYYLASSVQREKFRLDVKFQSDTAGVYLNYLPEPQVKDQPIIRLLGADRLDNNMKPNSNGYFDFVDGYTVANGRVFFPLVEPFGEDLYDYLVAKGVPAGTAQQYAYTELYDSTKTVAKQIAEKDKYLLMGQFRGSAANVISLGAYNVPQGSVKVTAGGVTLTEGSDYTVDYNAGEVTILNQSILDAGTAVNVSLESNTDYGQQRKTMLGLNWEYTFSRDFQLSGTFQHLSEQALTTKVNMGAEPLNNTLWGVNMNWKKESQWLTNMLNKVPFLHVTQPSQLSLNAEFAQLIAGQASGTQDNASYLDDFENTSNALDVSTPSAWIISSVPSMFANANDKTSLASGYQRSLLSWYNIEPLFTRRSSSLTPAHIKSDLEQLSNYYVREVYVRELFPNRDQSSYNGATSTIPVLNLNYYPSERGPYNFNPMLNSEGKFDNPKQQWGGMMRKLNTTDFESANVEYIEFWLMDPFVYTNEQANASEYGGDLYFNLGEVSEDVLRDGKKFYESGMPVDGSQAYTFSQWGKIPTQSTVTYAFATSGGSRALQDVGYNGLTDTEEQQYDTYQDFLTQIQGSVTTAVRDSIMNDPAGDDYHYFRGADLDEMKASIMRRYKYINNPQGNSPDNESRTEGYDTSYKTMPDVEDINQDYTLNEYEKYYQYRVSMRPEDMVVGRNFIVDKRETHPSLRNGETGRVTWYQFRIPLTEYESRQGSISDFTSIRFMRMFLTGFQHPIVLRFATLDLVRGEWRVYEQNLENSAQTGKLAVSSVNVEENSDKTPVNYVLPPGITRQLDPTQPQLVESNEQALDMRVTNLAPGESKAIYKNSTLDLRQYKRLQMFVHANAEEQNATALGDDQLAVFVRLGSDYKSNYYEYEIPLKLTAPGNYDRFSRADCERVWPEQNMLNVPLSVFTDVKKARNIAKSQGEASYNRPYSAYDESNPANKITVMGNPSLGEVKTMVIGVRNLSGTQKSGEVWVNELRLREYNNKGGWAAQGNFNVQLSDFGTVNVQGRYLTEGFGGLEDGVSQRSKDDQMNYSVTTSLELGKFFPDKAKVTAPLYFSYSKEEKRPKYNPLDTDMELDDALEGMEPQERDSIESIAVTKTMNKNFSLSNVRVGIQTKGHPMPYDPANFSFTYSHSRRHTSGETTVYEQEDNWKGGLTYSWTPNYKPWEPFAKIKNKSKWLDIVRRFGFNWLPQNIAFNTMLNRSYYELQERDMESTEGNMLPLTFNEQFLWNRDFSIRWDLTKNLHMNFHSTTHAEIEEPYTPVNKHLYPDQYSAWKDSVWTSIKNFGTPLDYNQTFTASYQVPLNLIPVFQWVNANASFSSSYKWIRGTELDDGTSLGNTVTTQRDVSVNSTFSMEKLYNMVPFLKKTNERFAKAPKRTKNKKTASSKQQETKGKGQTADKAEQQKKTLPKNQRAYETEITIEPGKPVLVKHGKKTNRFLASARTEDGKPFRLKLKKKDDNSFEVRNKVDSALKLKVTVTPREPLEKMKWYNWAQQGARFLMMIRDVNVTYRSQYNMSLPGFLPSVGDAFGQKRDAGVLSPGLDFAFGLSGDDYINKAMDRGWLMMDESVATPANTNRTEDFQLRVMLEPVRNFKIDLTASRTQTKARSIQYMYEGMPTTQSGMFTMTTISIGSAMEGIGSATSGYFSKSFQKFCNSLDDIRNQVEAQYIGAVYPTGTSLAGETFSPEHGTVDKYSADVMIPAFLQTYTMSGGKSLGFFPALTRLLPNWQIRYSGLSQMNWFRDHFKSFNINHGYKSIYAVGSYSTFSTFQEYMNGLGFVTNATTGMPAPSTMYNISSVSINEAFSPLLGVDMTFHNNLTTKLEYRTTRVLNLSMTSIQIAEAISRDWVIGFAYRINDFKFFGLNRHRQVKGKKNSGDEQKAQVSRQTAGKKGTVNHDLNMRLDISYRKQASITRDIASMTSSASSGNTALKLSFAADYTLSRLLTMTFFYDRQTNRPLLSSNSYPTTTRDFGLSLKFSLTR